jgi:hypothetical protein
MRDEESLRRLAEMGIDVYLPRAVEAASPLAMTDASSATAATGANVAIPANGANASTRDADVLLLADGAATVAEPLLAAVARTLAFARVTSARAGAGDAQALATARALVVFGEAQSRAAGAALSAQRQSQIGWIVAAGIAQLRGDALGKRALWGEIKRIVRELRVAQRG